MTETTNDIRVRFAPSPTGNLHIGGARTAVYNWAFAKRNGGKFILRIEDTDPERSTPQNTAQIIRSLKWLGLSWDEGPEVGGDYGPYLQTERFSTYGEALESLKAKDAVYPCFCTTDELAQRRDAAMAAKNYSGYDRKCRHLSKEEASARINNGEAHTWRLKIPLDRGDVEFDDLVFGNTTFPITQMDDFILVRSDGSPTYNYVVCLDDALMKISHVIRGDDHLSNTPKQILVYEALGMPVPRFAHLSMILGPDGKRLSKRHGATSVEAYKEQGFFPGALLNYLSLLGWSLDGETTIFDAEVLCDNFSLDRVSKNSAVFDEKKLEWVNASYIKEMGAPDFIDALLPYLREYGFIRNGSVMYDSDMQLVSGAKANDTDIENDVDKNRKWYEDIYPLIAERAKTIDEAAKMTAYLFSGSDVYLDEASINKCLKVEGAKHILERVTEVLSSSELNWNTTCIEDELRKLPDEMGIKPKVVFQAVRVAICGNTVSPPLFESIELLGAINTIARLLKATVIAS